ncbi:DNA replication/repair protein RecF [Roseomonas marmotae]|uniref:DNA replication and repair protein RecF n=1 Tax=Roseomonas marmotae TaxID=2768161 RepID=A0ABS3KBU4_9PROT|nr:DNA replication/repair protein RecF [Roseomonas marmotae]QTI80824.1 DNA replication/repair protein RecF [Roseomonas marmotae]
MPPALRLTRLMLRDFRSYAELDQPISGRVVVVAGANGVGKTNLLEAISLLGPGRGLRGARGAELGRREGAEGLTWVVAGHFDGPEGAVVIGTGAEAGQDRRSFRLDGGPVRNQAEIARHAAALWLTPQMDRLFQEGASGRRRFLDRLVWSLEPSHARDVAAHDAAMTQRNRLLAEGARDARWLAALEDTMARHAVAAVAARRSLALRLNGALAAGLAGAFPAARLDLLDPIAAALDEEPALAVEEALRAGLAGDRARDAAAGGARQGAHRTDLRMVLLPKEIPAELCSTGEQKALLVVVVLAQAALVAAHRGFAPLLLLDEVAAHLDPGRREALFAVLAGLPAQCFLTGTEFAPFQPLHGVAEAFLARPGGLAPADLPVPNPA